MTWHPVQHTMPLPLRSCQGSAMLVRMHKLQGGQHCPSDSSARVLIWLAHTMALATDQSSCAVRQASWMHAGMFCMISALSTRLLNHQWHMRTHSSPPSPLSSPHMRKRSSLCTAPSTETYGMDWSVWSLDTVLDGPDFPTLDLMYVPPHIFSLALGPHFLQLYLSIAPYQIGLIQLGGW